MKRLLSVLLAAALFLAPTGCAGGDTPGEASADGTNLPSAEGFNSLRPGGADAAGPSSVGNESRSGDQEDEMIPVALTVGERTFSAELNGGDAAKALAERLPLTMEMSELNGNEKYFYMEDGLPADARKPVQIRNGDIMLFGGDCLVIFYKDFTSGYSYTPLGRVGDPESLAEALGTGGVTVVLEGKV